MPKTVKHVSFDQHSTEDNSDADFRIYADQSCVTTEVKPLRAEVRDFLL